MAVEVKPLSAAPAAVKEKIAEFMAVAELQRLPRDVRDKLESLICDAVGGDVAAAAAFDAHVGIASTEDIVYRQATLMSARHPKSLPLLAQAMRKSADRIDAVWADIQVRQASNIAPPPRVRRRRPRRLALAAGRG